VFEKRRKSTSSFRVDYNCNEEEAFVAKMGRYKSQLKVSLR
jgi:hypothetical protein